MNTKIKIILYVLTICIFSSITIFLPELHIKYKDEKYINKLNLIKEEYNDFKINDNISLESKLSIIADFYNEKQNPILIINDENELKINDKLLLDNVKKQVENLIELNIIPDISNYNYEDNFVESKLYTVSSTEIYSDAFSFWSINFSDNLSYNFTFDVDTKNYKVYNYKICCKEIQEEVDKYKNENSRTVMNKIQKFTDNYKNYMGASESVYKNLEDYNIDSYNNEFNINRFLLLYEKRFIVVSIDLYSEKIGKEIFLEFSIRLGDH